MRTTLTRIGRIVTLSTAVTVAALTITACGIGGSSKEPAGTAVTTTDQDDTSEDTDDAETTTNQGIGMIVDESQASISDGKDISLNVSSEGAHVQSDDVSLSVEDSGVSVRGGGISLDIGENGVSIGGSRN